MKNLNGVVFNYLKNFGLTALFICFAFSFSFAQSTNQLNPTPIKTNEINGTIRARDIGDSRLTNYFYTFNGNQGDVFINVVTKNLDGDIDVFIIDGLRPLTKITLFSDNSENETGRIVYLRKPEKLLLRIQGRSPNDEPATFTIKFAGSFQPSDAIADAENEKLPEINTKNQGEFRVNSVGTIIEPIAKPTPEPKVIVEDKEETTVAETETPKAEMEITVKSVDKMKTDETATKIEIKRNNPVEEKPEITTAEENKQEENVAAQSKPSVIITDETLSQTEEISKPEEPKIEEPETVEDKKTETVNSETVTEPASKTVRPMKSEELEKIELVVKFKDGKTLKYPMSKVFSFNVNQGILTIVLYDGNVTRYSFLDIDKISMEEIVK